MLKLQRRKKFISSHYVPDRVNKRKLHSLIPLTAIILFAGSLLFNNISPPKVMAAITFDANLGNSFSSTNSTVHTHSTIAAAASGSTIIAAFRAYNTFTTLAVSGGGLTWSTDLTVQGNSLDNFYIASAYAPSGLPSSSTITFTTGASTVDTAMLVSSFTGIAKANRVDQQNSSWATINDDIWNSGNIATTNANDLIFGAAFYDNVTATFLPDATYNELADYTINNMSFETVYRIVSSTGTYAPGGEGTGSSTSRAQTGIAYKASSAPAAPTLSSPSNGATGVSTTPQFQLRTTDVDTDYLEYKIEVCSVSDCSSIVRTIDQTSSQTGWSGQDQQTSTAYTGSSVIGSSTLATHTYQSPPLSANTQYWWRAYAIDPGGSNTFSTASSISSFTTVNTNTAPAAPTLIEPPASASAVANSPIFQLRTTDANNDYIKYFIQIYDATACGGSQVGSNIDQTSSQTGWQGQDASSGTAYIGSNSISGSTIARYQYSGTPLTLNHTYSWRAKAIDPGGTNTFGSLSSCADFTVGNAAVEIRGGTQINGGSTIQ